MEDVEIKEEPALNWWQIYEDSLDGKFSYVKEKDKSGQERRRYITNVQEYAKLWFNDESFRIRKLESFKTKEEVERNRDQPDFDFDYPLLLKRDEILKDLKMGCTIGKPLKSIWVIEYGRKMGKLPKGGLILPVILRKSGHFNLEQWRQN